VPEIIVRVLTTTASQSERLIRFQLTANTPARLLASQYDETDLHFIHRSVVKKRAIQLHFETLNPITHLLVIRRRFKPVSKAGSRHCYIQAPAMVAQRAGVIQTFCPAGKTRPSRVTRRELHL